MERPRLCPRATRLLSLIAIVQVPLSSAFPFFHDLTQLYASLSDTVAVTQTVSCSSGDFKPTPTNTVYEIQDEPVQARGPPAPASPASVSLSSASSNAFYQIADGQMQASYGASAQDASITSGSTASSSSSTSVLTVRDLPSATTTTTEATVSSGTTLTEFVSEATAPSEAETPSTSIPDTSLTSLSASEVQTASETGPSGTSGTVFTSLETSGQTSAPPFATSIPSATSSLSLISSKSLDNVHPSATADVTRLTAPSIFQAIATGPPPFQISQRSDHPLQPADFGVQNQTRKLQTNKFYSNFYLGKQGSANFIFPYSVTWARGAGDVGSWGLAVSHIDRNQTVFAPRKPGKDAGNAANMVNPIGIYSVILSAVELANDTYGNTPKLTTDSLEWGSVNVNLKPITWYTPVISFPLVQGSSFITANYHWGTPLIQSGVGFDEITYAGPVIANTTYKYRLALRNGLTWLMYVTPDYDLSPNYTVESFTLNGSSTSMQGQSDFNGLIQVAKLPSSVNLTTYSSPTGTPEDLYDQAAGAYAASVNITGSVDDKMGSYTFNWTKQGTQNQTLLMFALPHHMNSFDANTKSNVTSLQLWTTVKGLATAVKGTSWFLNEDNLPIDMGFAPWTPDKGSVTSLSTDAQQTINRAAEIELKQNVFDQADTYSFYYDGKALAKFAALVYTLNDLAGNKTLAYTGLKALQDAFAYHVNGEQMFALVYDSAWGGAVSDASYLTNDSGVDFGNTYYNDHHFHYGYFVYAAAVIGYLNSTWLNDTNVAWVNTLVRDFANPIPDDPYFPMSRSFDWYHGHSWAAGLFDMADGKNQESSSEDTMASYGIKMWGRVIGDNNMQARGNLMLAIQRRSMQDYYLYEDSNDVLPKTITGNKVAGILFENKIDHTTFFGDQPQYVQGIHMIPLMPFSTYIRTPTFVQEEWAAYFDNNTGVPYYQSITGGWRGIVMADYAIINPTEGYQFFSNSTFDTSYLDGGASQTWYLAWCNALGGVSYVGSGGSAS